MPPPVVKSFIKTLLNIWLNLGSSEERGSISSIFTPSLTRPQTGQLMSFSIICTFLYLDLFRSFFFFFFLSFLAFFASFFSFSSFFFISYLLRAWTKIKWEDFWLRNHSQQLACPPHPPNHCCSCWCLTPILSVDPASQNSGIQRWSDLLRVGAPIINIIMDENGWYLDSHISCILSEPPPVLFHPFWFQNLKIWEMDIFMVPPW